MGDDDLTVAVLDLLAAEGLAPPGARLDRARRLTGGASRQTWALDLVGPDGTERPLIVQRARAGTVSGGPGMAGEAALLRAAADAGVPVPAVLADDDGTRTGAPCMVMDRLEGETIARRLLRDDEWAAARARLAADAGAALAAIHRIPTGAAPGLRSADQLEEMAGLLHGLDRPFPAFELALRWLAAHRPATSSDAVVHGDFRMGNLLVGRDGLRGVLDWELAHRGDPAEDLGWFCVRAWRFGSPLPAGGVGTREELLAAYRTAGGRAVEPEVLRWWELLGTLKWGLICVVQSEAHLSGAARSVELATIGRRICENEWDVLTLLPGGPMPGPDVTPEPAGAGLHGRPTASELVEAVREFLETDVRDGLDGRVAFLGRVAVNALAMVERELALAPAQEEAHRRRLADLGVADDAELAARIRDGSYDDPGSAATVRAAVAADVRSRLEVANPGWLDGP